jgi:hypothetical protein
MRRPHCFFDHLKDRFCQTVQVDFVSQSCTEGGQDLPILEFVFLTFTPLLLFNPKPSLDMLSG